MPWLWDLAAWILSNSQFTRVKLLYLSIKMRLFFFFNQNEADIISLNIGWHRTILAPLTLPIFHWLSYMKLETTNSVPLTEWNAEILTIQMSFLQYCQLPWASKIITNWMMSKIFWWLSGNFSFTHCGDKISMSMLPISVISFQGQ